MNPKTLTAALNSDRFSEADKCAIKWQYGLYGGFYSKLFAAIAHADHWNLQKLSQGFPDEVQGYENWTDGDLVSRLIALEDEDESENRGPA